MSYVALAVFLLIVVNALWRWPDSRLKATYKRLRALGRWHADPR